ncbi:MAG: ABC-2 transporter permease, partial [Tissierellia bacterium]|nr:ABC-2 transporter permease [Tissierellia bacterium]
MFNLVIKDLKLSAKINIFAFFFPVFISWAGLNIDTPLLPVNLLYILSIFMISYFSVMSANGYDHKNKVDVVLNSMPIHRKDIVKGKYAMLPIYTITHFLLIFLLTNILIFIGIGRSGKAARLWDLITAMNILLIFYSIYFPIYFKSENGLLVFNQIIYMLIILIPSMMSRFAPAILQMGIVRSLIEIDIKNVSMIILG